MKCQRCRKQTFGLIMSKFNTQEICLDCKDAEEAYPLYLEADTAESEAVAAGNYNFQGVGCPADLRQKEQI